MGKLITTLGHKLKDELGLILPHEHLFVDLRTYEADGFGEAQVEDVVAKMAPEVEKAKAVGVTALVECSPVGVARRAEMDKAVSDATNFPVLVPTGIYREPWIPPWAHEASQQEITDWMLKELNDEIEDTGVQAAWIKLSAGDEGLTECETKILRGAAHAGKTTNAIIGSHTIKGRVVRDQLDILEEEGYTASRFIWIHTQAEPDFDLHLEMADRGCWLEYDALGNANAPSDEIIIGYLKKLIVAGYSKQILLSHDRGWYDAGNPDYEPMPFTYLSETFIPKLRDAGFEESMIKQLTHDNPFNAYAR